MKRMRRGVVIILMVLFMTLGVLPVVHEISAKDTVDYLGYYARQPWRLLWVAAIAIISGLVALAISRLVIAALKKIGRAHV